METNMKIPTREQMLDGMGKPLTQSLFLEIGYTEQSVYTLKDQDHFHDGKWYPSLKRLYLETEDPTEYEFATTFLLGWKHWMRLCENKAVRRHVDEWREELEIKLRSKGVKEVLKSALAGNYQAAKYLSDRGWDTRGAGRPSKAEIEHEKKVQAAISDEYSADIIRLREAK
jgi:hypothetical protein